VSELKQFKLNIFMKTHKILTLSVLTMASCYSYGQKAVQNDKEQQKKALIQSNPQDYQKMGGTLKDPEFKTKAEKVAYDQKQKFANKPVREHSAFPADPTFPKYINTGNKSLDASNYMTAKQEWISNNQSKYDKMVKPEGTPLSKAERLKLDEQLKN